MAIHLSDYEGGHRYPGDYDTDLAALQKRLAHLQAAHIVHRRRSVILFEGWDAGGKGGTIQRLTARWDPRYFEVWPIGPPSPDELARHFLWRFWRRLPADRTIAVFDRSWYGRVLVERVQGLIGKKDWKRGYDEINAFEHEQKDSGTAIIKLFLHVTPDEQEARLRARLEHPWKRWKITPDDFRNRDERAAYLDVLHDMFAQTDTRWAPWRVIDGNHKKAARIAALAYVAERLEAHVPTKPPALDAAVAALARERFGIASEAE